MSSLSSPCQVKQTRSAKRRTVIDPPEKRPLAVEAGGHGNLESSSPAGRRTLVHVVALLHAAIGSPAALAEGNWREGAALSLLAVPHGRQDAEDS